MSEPHPPRTSAPSEAGALTVHALLCDAETGVMSTYAAWLENCIEAESRTHAECVEQLMNAIARGDLTVAGYAAG